jgi:hypothetical protein
MGNPKTQAPLDTRHKTLFPLSGILKTLEKTEGTIMNGQLRDSGSIGHKTENEGLTSSEKLFNYIIVRTSYISLR